MVKKTAKLAILALCGGLVVGCASNGDIANLQAQLDDVKAQATAASSAADQAAASASAAERAAEAAEAAANETSAKLDRMFKKSMSK
jgi:outer membrane murein-binding lipoprotein Lpp